MVAAQQSAPAVSRACSTGLQKLLQQQSAVSGTLQHACRCLSGQADTAQQQRRQQAAAAAALTSSTSRSKLSYISPKKRGGYRARLPRVRKYGAELQDKDPAAFDRMRLVLGYYDLPQNRHKPRPLPPSHVTINNLQTIMFTKDVDPYYKLALLNYRSKLVNMKLLPVSADQVLSSCKQYGWPISAMLWCELADCECCLSCPPLPNILRCVLEYIMRR
eukprot:GHRR01025312.1.p1 GENE.GHRR01025312.1~~GHRR01025312.1.p1  ORF type:complete len:218 (+),score=64.30 GHRR01025312.1:192-845(+)